MDVVDGDCAAVVGCCCRRCTGETVKEPRIDNEETVKEPPVDKEETNAEDNNEEDRTPAERSPQKVETETIEVSESREDLEVVEVQSKGKKPRNKKASKSNPAKIKAEVIDLQDSGSPEAEVVTPPKKKKARRRLKFSVKRKTSKSSSTDSNSTAALGKRKLKISNDTATDSETEAPKVARPTKLLRNERMINEYRRKVMREANKEFVAQPVAEEAPLKPQKIQFNPVLKVLPFAKLVRRSLSERIAKPEILTKDCQYRSVLKGSSSTFNSKVKYSHISMFPNSFEVFEDDLIDHEREED